MCKRGDVRTLINGDRVAVGEVQANEFWGMHKECADQIEAACLPVVLQFGETQWWYIDNQQQDPNRLAASAKSPAAFILQLVPSSARPAVTFVCCPGLP